MLLKTELVKDNLTRKKIKYGKNKYSTIKCRAC